MKTSSQTVQIERHELPGGLVALTFSAPIMQNTPALPLVFVLHGLGSRKERHLDVCLRLANAGFMACALDARSHGERWTPEGAGLHSNERTSLAFVVAFADAVQGTAQDVGQVADYLRRDRYGVMGHSMGGFTALHVALRDKRAIAVVNVAGSLDVRVPAGFSLPPEIAALADGADPAARAADLWPCALLLLHGERDETVPVAGARRLYQAATPFYAADPSRLVLEVLPNAGHEWTSYLAERSVDWMTRYLGAGNL